MNLSGKVVVITGASGGIGHAIAWELHRRSAHLVLTGRREPSLIELRDALQAAGGRATIVVGDITQAETAQKIVDHTLHTYGRIDVLINNAGYGPPATLLETTDEIWDATIDSCLKSVFLMTRGVLPTMLDANAGHIVQVSSVAGKHGYANRSAYCAAKWGVQGFTEALRDELRETDIRLYTVNPAAVATGWWGTTNDAQPKEVLERMVQPEEVAEAVAWMLEQPGNTAVDEIVLRTFRSPWE